MSLEIIVCHDRWHFIGSVTENGDKLIIANARNIRQWGTTRGLGEIALLGPTQKTVLDDYGVVTVQKDKVVCRIACLEKQWKST